MRRWRLERKTTASDQDATAMGSLHSASGWVSTAMGVGTTAQALGSLALGRFNRIAGDIVNWLPTDPVFVIENGTDGDNRYNAFVVRENGNTRINGDLFITGSCTGCSSDEQLKNNVPSAR